MQKSPISTKKRAISDLSNVSGTGLLQALDKLCRRKAGNLVEVAPGGGTKAITYIGEELVDVLIGVAFHGFHHIIDATAGDVFHKRLSRVTAERFAHIRAVGAQLHTKGTQAQIGAAPFALLIQQLGDLFPEFILRGGRAVSE